MYLSFQSTSVVHQQYRTQSRTTLTGRTGEKTWNNNGYNYVEELRLELKDLLSAANFFFAFRMRMQLNNVHEQ